MIHVTRSNDIPDLTCYRKKKQKGLKRFKYRYKGEVLTDAEYEKKVACDHFADAAEKTGEFEFWIYKRKAIRDRLLRVFRNRCAYCEYPVGVRHDWDVEHFRPKGAVNDSDTGELKPPGYYWLAADWHNLMPSCQYCNQSRQHEIAGKVGKYTLGKKNQFPLKDEARRLCQPGQKVDEEEDYRLLLNPCVDHPEEYLRFITSSDSGEMGEVRPVMHGDEPDEKGETSILVYALNSKVLVDARAKHSADLIELLTRLSDLAGDYHGAVKRKETESAAAFYRELGKAMADLKGRLTPGADFLGMTRQLVLDHKDRGTIGLLKQRGIDLGAMVAKSVEASARIPE